MIGGQNSPSFEKKQTLEDLLRDVYACGKSLTFCDETDRGGLAPTVAAVRTDNADVEVQAQSDVVARRRGPVAADAACEVDGSTAIAATAVAGSREKHYACILQSLEVIICICV